MTLLTYQILYLSGLIHVGDELREVNGIPVEDKRPEEIIQILVSCHFIVNLGENQITVLQVSQFDLDSALQTQSAAHMYRNTLVHIT